MDGDISIDNEDLLYGGDDFLDQLCNEYKWSSLLHAVDASPSEILADAAASPQISFKSSPVDSSNDSGSDDDLKKNGLSTSIAWEINADDIKTEELRLEDVEQFLQIPDAYKTTKTIPTPNVRPPEHHGPVMAIENGVIKIESIKRDINVERSTANVDNNSTLNNDKITGNNLQDSYFKVVNEHSSYNKHKNGGANKVPIIITPKAVSILKKPPKVASNGATIVLSPNSKNNGIILPQTHLNGSVQKSEAIQIKVLPTKHNNTVIKSQPVIAQCETNNIIETGGVVPKVEFVKSPSPVEQFSCMTDAEIRAIKKHQRMIKNRESACQSRKKKKDYVTALEQQLLEAHQEIARLQLENRMLKDQLDTCGRVTRKLPRLDPAAFIPRKNVAVIFAMIFMVSMNWNSLSWSDKSVSVPSVPSSGSRHLLWEDNTSNTYSSSEENFDQPTNRSSNPNCHNSTVTVDDLGNINQTESIRIAGELNRWIGRGKKLNWTYSGTRKGKHDKIREGILETYRLFNKLNMDNNFLDFATNRYQARNIRDRSRLRKLRRKDMDFNDNNLLDYNRIYSKHLNDDLKVLKEFGEWSALVEALHRRDDTFYVVGVGTGEHLLLPAVTHNVTRPPKMALILPARTGNESVMSGHVTLMQIDCSVVNTTIVKLKSDALPESVRKTTEDILNKKETLQPANFLQNSSNVLKSSKKFTENLYKPKLDRNIVNFLFNKHDSKVGDDNITLERTQKVLQENNLKMKLEPPKIL